MPPQMGTFTPTETSIPLQPASVGDWFHQHFRADGVRLMADRSLRRASRCYSRTHQPPPGLAGKKEVCSPTTQGVRLWLNATVKAVGMRHRARHPGPAGPLDRHRHDRALPRRSWVLPASAPGSGAGFDGGGAGRGHPGWHCLSRPHRVDKAERFMQFFNVGNTIPPLAVLAIALSILGIAPGLRSSRCSSPPSCPSCATPTRA